MAREIFQVTAHIVDANGTYNALSGYPKNFDSRNYQNDIGKAQQRAIGEWHEVMGAFAKRDDRQLQMAQVIQLSTGAVVENDYIGSLNTEEVEE